MARALARLLLLVLTIGAACSGSGHGAAAGARADTTQQATAAPARRDTAEARAAVLRLEQELFQSFERSDTTPSARILADDYVGITGDGHRETKAQALANLRRDSTTAAGATSASLQVDSTTVRVYGDAAVAHASGTFRSRRGGQPVAIGFQNTDVFVWRGGRWQVVATHLSRVAEPPGPPRTP